MDKVRVQNAQFNEDDLSALFADLCEVGDLESIRYMLTAPDLHIRPDFDDIADERDEVGLTLAAANGHLNVVQYLLFSPELKKHDSFPSDYFDYLKLICRNGQFHVADYLKEKEIFDPLLVFDRVLFHGRQNDNLAEYLIINCDIPVTSKVQKVINGVPFIAQLFEKRELNKELKKNLDVLDTPNKRYKL